MHLGVVKVGLLWLAKPEVFCQRIIFKKNSMKDKISSNFDNPYYYSSTNLTNSVNVKYGNA